MKIPPKYHSNAELRKEIMKYKREVLKDYIAASKELSKACKSVMNEFIGTQKPSKNKNKNKNIKVQHVPSGSSVPPPPPPPPQPGAKKLNVKINKNKNKKPPPPPPPPKNPLMNQLKQAIKNKKQNANKHSINTVGK